MELNSLEKGRISTSIQSDKQKNTLLYSDEIQCDKELRTRFEEKTSTFSSHLKLAHVLSHSFGY